MRKRNCCGCSYYWKEALCCEEAKAYLAGLVMLGSALETVLILMISLYHDEADRTGTVPHNKGTPKPLLKWELVELIRVAKAAGWFHRGSSSATIGIQA
jgi:hypothetical protein